MSSRREGFTCLEGSVDITLGRNMSDILPAVLRKKAGTRSRHVHLKETVDETESVVKILKKRMLEKSRREAILTQQAQQARANEATLSAELERETTTQKTLRRRIEEAKDRRDGLKQQNDSKIVTLLECDKQKSTFTMQIRDLNEELNRTLSKERRVTSQLLHAQRKCREMEAELADVRHDNRRTQDNVDNKLNEKYELEEKLNQMTDLVLRDAQRAQVDWSRWRRISRSQTGSSRGSRLGILTSLQML